jgi:FAD/FMN-containing dehydrogenase
VIETVALCREHGAPVLSRGGGTSLAGQCCNVAVLIDFSKYLNRVLEIDPARGSPACSPADPRRPPRPGRARASAHLRPRPSTHTHCTLGGMIGNNSCGVRSVMSQFYGPGRGPRQRATSSTSCSTTGGGCACEGTSGDEEIDRA